MPEHTTHRLAHRGDWREAPENTVAAMEAALRIPGCDGLEFDIRCSADGVPVLLHDETLERVQRIAAACVALTAAQLAEHGVPTLAEVLRAVGCDAFLDIELKDHVPAIVDVLEVERGGVDDDGGPTLRSAVISTFDTTILAWLAAERPTWPRWLNALDLSPATIDLARALGCTAIAVQWQAVDEPSVARVHDASLGFAAWTVRDLDDYRRIEALGALAICVEPPALDGSVRPSPEAEVVS